MKAPKLYKGKYRGTDNNGNDHYLADYFIPKEVEQYVTDSSAVIAELEKENGDLHVRFEAMSELIAELDAIVLLLEWVMDESEDWILSGEDLMRINEAIEKVRG